MNRFLIKSCMVLLGVAISMVTLSTLAGIYGKTLPTTAKAADAPGMVAKASAMSANPGSQSDDPFQAEGKGSANPTIYGKTYGMWAAEWWQWALSFPDGMNPVQDETGEFCDLGQAGPVWFLAGSFGVPGVERECTIPAGKAIFYPIINAFWVDCPGTSDEDLSDEEVRWIMSALVVDTACQLTSTLDTSDVFGAATPTPISALMQPMVRSQSPVFHLDLPVDHLVSGCVPDLPPGETGRTIAAGYWVMLPPLTVGEHTLSLHGAGCDMETGEVGFETSVTYTLTVVPGSGQ